jgi:hypothetical protein
MKVSLGWRWRASLTAGLMLVALTTAAAPAASAAPVGWAAIAPDGPGNGAANARVFAFETYGSELYVAGTFEAVGGQANANYLVKWNGSSWSQVGTSADGGSVFTASVRSLAVANGYLYAGGDFVDAAGITEADYVARWDGTSWSAVGSNGAKDGAIPTRVWHNVQALTVSGADLYVGGTFDDLAGIQAADNIARWDGSTWSAVGSDSVGDGAISGGVADILVSGDGVYAAGSFRDANGNPAADHIALWDGTDWLALGSNSEGGGALSDTVSALVMIGSDLYAGGNFLNIYGSPGFTNYISRWDGASWHGVGVVDEVDEDFNGPIFALAVLDGKLIAGGDFGARADYIAKLEGSTWSTLGPDGALNYSVFALYVRGSDVYAGGYFVNAAGIPDADHAAVYHSSSVSHQPDARIQVGTTAVRGNNIFNADGTNQTITTGKPPGKAATFKITIQNDGTARERFRVQATGPSSMTYTVRYFRGTTDVTSQITAGTFETAVLPPGAKVAISVTVKVKSTSAAGSSLTRLITAQPSTGTPVVDAVKLVVQRR